MISVAIVDDNEVHRNRLGEAVRSCEGMALVGTASDAESACRLLREASIDVLLVDLGLPDRSGVEVIRFARQHRPQTDLLVVTVFTDERHVFRSIEAGATGYLLKDASVAELRAAIFELRAGGSPISPLMARHLLNRFRPVPAKATDGKAMLSAREVEVLQVVAKGMSVAETAGVLHLSPMTVATHVKNIYRKLAVNSRTEAVYEAGRLGLLVL